jgi:hypothetical protein
LRTLRSFAPFAFYLGQMRHGPRLLNARYITEKRKGRKVRKGFGTVPDIVESQVQADRKTRW